MSAEIVSVGDVVENNTLASPEPSIRLTNTALSSPPLQL